MENPEPSESPEVTDAFAMLDAEEKAAADRKHRLSVKQVAGIVILLALAPMAILWVFQYLG